MAKMTLAALERELLEISRVEPLGMRRARAAVAAAATTLEYDHPVDGDGVRALWREWTEAAKSALDDVTAARRNDDGLGAEDQAWALERDIEYAYGKIEGLAELAAHAGGKHSPDDGKFCPAH